jgi:hypothetical protein
MVVVEQGPGGHVLALAVNWIMNRRPVQAAGPCYAVEPSGLRGYLSRWPPHDCGD